MQAVQNHFSCFAKWDTSLKVGFQKSEITLNIPDDGELTQEGWKITPMTYPAVSLHIVHLCWQLLTLLYITCACRLLGGKQTNLQKGSGSLSVNWWWSGRESVRHQFGYSTRLSWMEPEDIKTTCILFWTQQKVERSVNLDHDWTVMFQYCFKLIPETIQLVMGGVWFFTIMPWFLNHLVMRSCSKKNTRQYFWVKGALNYSRQARADRFNRCPLPQSGWQVEDVGCSSADTRG